jgi:hypothetical protein
VFSDPSVEPRKKKVKYQQQEQNTMNKKKDTEAKKPSIFEICYCPVCGIPRQKGNHAKCSRITQLKGMKERGEI